MIREAVLPNEFQELNGKVHYVQKVSNNEYSGSCPNCGGDVHQGGELPDRFRMILRNRKGNVMGFCRKCGHVFIPTDDRYKSAAPTNQKREIPQPSAAETAALEHFKTHNRAMELHKNMGDYGYEQWYARGVGISLIDYYKLGYIEKYPVADKETGEVVYHQALSIPCYNSNWEVIQIYYRLLTPGIKGKYRQTSDILPGLFIADPEQPLTGDVILVEGQIKAIITMEEMIGVGGEKLNKALAKVKDMNVCGMPSCWATDQLLYPLRNARKIYVNLDPDIYDNENNHNLVERVANTLKNLYGRTVYELRLWGKIDDMIVDGSLTGDVLLDILETCNKL